MEVVGPPWNEKVVAGTEEVEVEVAEGKPNPTVVTPSFLSITLPVEEDEMEVEELDDDDEELSSFSSVWDKFREKLLERD